MAIAGLLLLAASAGAQEGFPLDGTWRGEHVGPDGAHRTIVLVMQWDGKQVNGTVNPGPKGTDFTGGQLTPQGWKFTLGYRNAQGMNVRFDGAISNLGKYDRVLAGRWTEGATSFDIRFVHE
jgi:hypothetical protein